MGLYGNPAEAFMTLKKQVKITQVLDMYITQSFKFQILKCSLCTPLEQHPISKLDHTSQKFNDIKQ